METQKQLLVFILCSYLCFFPSGLIDIKTKRSLQVQYYLVTNPYLILVLFLMAENYGVEGPTHNERHKLYGFRPTKLFVFGDSYSDTGNVRKAIANSWKVPYGITFPGKPAGRFSDGRVFTDYLARYLGLKSPTPYRWRRYAGKRLRYGMNFAYGGTGVFDTTAPEPNMTTQIDFFQQLIHDKVYTQEDLASSIALVTLAGNDYGAFKARNGSAGLINFIPLVVNQLVVDLKRIRGVGLKKIAVTALQPLGCLPQSTYMTSFQRCNGTENMLVGYHNLLLQNAVAKLNTEAKDTSFVILDLYDSFLSVLNDKGKILGSAKFENPLKPCCLGMSSDYRCGSIEENGSKKYTVCDDPGSAFFWDMVHPTQEGWRAVYIALQSTLEHLY
ncbi:GDSL lipase/esterase [Dillenia turbinata]|uniref:GDSL lipase/esterase n=1 Tax=Dillenia turbinata TaxID=194707 RepID=A0AAN8W284_9MAGN